MYYIFFIMFLFDVKAKRITKFYLLINKNMNMYVLKWLILYYLYDKKYFTFIEISNKTNNWLSDSIIFFIIRIIRIIIDISTFVKTIKIGYINKYFSISISEL